MPESCCESCITTPMISGDRKVGEHMSSVMEIVASACCARSSALISSMSSSTWLDDRNLRNAVTSSYSCITHNSATYTTDVHNTSDLLNNRL
jgi:hypothetical protein